MTGDKAVKICADAISGEYRRKVVLMDEKLGYTDGPGPALRRLQQYQGGEVLDLVFGGEGSASEGVWTLPGHMANCRLMKLGLARGSPGSQQELATITGELTASQLGSPQGQPDHATRKDPDGGGRRQAGREEEEMEQAGGGEGEVGQTGPLASSWSGRASS